MGSIDGGMSSQPSMPNTAAVLFDLDGTLVDSLPGIADAYRVVLSELALDDLDDADLTQFVGPPIREVLGSHYGLEGLRLEQGVQRFREHYGSNGLLEFDTYPGIDDLLDTLYRRGLRLAIATSKMTTMADQVIEHAGWSGYFSFIGGAEADSSRYLKEDVLRWALDHVADEVPALAMVGDRAADIAAARSLGLTAVGVTWGYGSHEELEQAGANVIVATTPELLETLVELDQRVSGPLS
jgi:phosphoglycolate phosphatase